MPRREFVADVSAIDDNSLPPGIFRFGNGEDDGVLVFDFMNGDETIAFSAMVPEVADYPREHTWFIYTTSESASPQINSLLDETDFGSTRVKTMLSLLTTLFTTNTKPETQLHGNESDIGSGDEEEDLHIDDDDIYFTPVQQSSSHGGLFTQEGESPSSFTTNYLTAEQQHTLARHLKHDLSLVKAAGYRISIIGNVFSGSPCILSLSCRIKRLGIQENVANAWGLNNKVYVLLAIRYTRGYLPLEEALASGRSSIALRMIATDHYKLSLEQTQSLFESYSEDKKPATHEVNDTAFDYLIIDGPLTEFLNQRFLQLVRYRRCHGLSWRGAELYYLECQGKFAETTEFGEEWHQPEPQPYLSTIARADHLSEKRSAYSLPLAAMQLSLRHLVRCVEFCQVCHDRVKTSFEALKPYVCEKPLCLYQYISLGFGPSIETEIMRQPDVVDLLISFCYRAAVSTQLMHRLPEGLQLTVPPVIQEIESLVATQQYFSQHKKFTVFQGQLNETGSIMFSLKKFPNADSELGALPKPGQWVYLTGATVHAHCLIKESHTDGSFALGELVYTFYSASGQVNTGAINDKKKQRPVVVTVWDQQFAEMCPVDQEATIVTLITMLPGVQQIRDHLLECGEASGALVRWTERLPPAAVTILRWIIASNRSCIVQVDSNDSQIASEAGLDGLPNSYLQFRFAQGAPAKEQRFVEAVTAAQKRTGSNYPTIFAWHGSPLQHWHNIIREGLNFNRIVHGRAHGDGVYHAIDAATSLSYSNRGNVMPLNTRLVHTSCQWWPSSRLKIMSALCLNEIVNAPDEFVKQGPVLVIRQLDWIQTRYLIVHTLSPNMSIKSLKAKEFIRQDPSYLPTMYHPTGVNQRIGVPSEAIPPSRRVLFKRQFKTLREEMARRKEKETRRSLSKAEPKLTTASGNVDVHGKSKCSSNSSSYSSGIASCESTMSEIALYAASKHSCELIASQSNVTNFSPGSLDVTTLPKLAPPAYATSQASRTLQREMKALLDVQAKTKLAELGWYLDQELVHNLYQWIIELHSFPTEIPLAQDLKESNITSVVLELRFGPSFPYAPPFVRVIRPRFVPFMRGGGGHVTSGGALCMELLTNSGWNPASSIEALLLQVRMAILNPEPAPARLLKNPQEIEYGIGEAIEAFRRACRTHGWRVPEELQRIQQM